MIGWSDAPGSVHPSMVPTSPGETARSVPRRPSTSQASSPWVNTTRMESPTTEARPAPLRRGSPPASSQARVRIRPPSPWAPATSARRASLVASIVK